MHRYTRSGTVRGTRQDRARYSETRLVSAVDEIKHVSVEHPWLALGHSMIGREAACHKFEPVSAPYCTVCTEGDHVSCSLRAKNMLKVCQPLLQVSGLPRQSPKAVASAHRPSMVVMARPTPFTVNVFLAHIIAT